MKKRLRMFLPILLLYYPLGDRKISCIKKYYGDKYKVKWNKRNSFGNREWSRIVRRLEKYKGIQTLILAAYSLLVIFL